MIAARPAHDPLRLVAIFVASALAFAIVASAAGASLYIFDDLRAPASAPASGADAPRSSVTGPSDVIVLAPLDGERAFREDLGFAPVKIVDAPEGTNPAPSYFRAVGSGWALGQVRYAAGPANSEGIVGPAIVLTEQMASGAASQPVAMRSERRADRLTFTAGLLCGDVHVQLSATYASLPAVEDPALLLQLRESVERLVGQLDGKCTSA